MAGSSRVRHIVHGLALVVGGVALAFLLHRLGREGLRRVLFGIGGWFALIAAIDLASVGCDAAAVYSFVRPRAPISYLRVFAAQASGLAINRLTPGNALGEPIKVTMLVEHVPQSVAVSGIVMYNLTTLGVGVTVQLIGLPLTLSLIDVPARVELAIWIGTGLLVVLSVGVAIMVRRGAIASVVGAIRRLRLISAPRAARWDAKIASIDLQVRTLGQRSSWRALVAVIAARCLNWTGTLVLLKAADVPLTAPFVVAMLSLGLLVTWMSNVIPLGLGLADGGNYALYGLLGASPIAGLDFAMVNRARTCLLAIMGLTVMAIASLADRGRR